MAYYDPQEPEKTRTQKKVSAEKPYAINFDYKRNWEEKSVQSIQFVVYKNKEGLYVDPDKQMYALDGKKEDGNTLAGDEGTIGTEPQEPTKAGNETQEKSKKVGFFKAIINFIEKVFTSIIGK